jgi:GMP reductase
MKDFLLSYDNVTLRPRYSTLTSRSLADTTLKFGKHTFDLPVVPANMQDVISPSLAKYLSEHGYFYIYHRFGKNTDESEENLTPVYFVKKANRENWRVISVSTGVSESSKKEILTYKALRLRVDYITIDVAHAHHENIKMMVEYIRENLPDTFLIVGNTATGEGVDFLCSLNVDAIKVGIGGGSICTTRYMTGFHLPTLHSVFEANEIMSFRSLDIPIIADGGAKHYGDIAKALTFGATMVMSGGWFVSCSDSPAKMYRGKKVYRGSTSFDSKGEHKHIEGRTLELEAGFTYKERLTEIRQSLQSSISYAGGSDLGAFQHVNWERLQA